MKARIVAYLLLGMALFAGGLILNWTLHRDTVVRPAPPLVLSDAARRAARRAERALLPRLGIVVGGHGEVVQAAVVQPADLDGGGAGQFVGG